MKKIVLIATLAASVPAFGLPTYEPFTEFATQVTANPTNAIDLCSNGLTAPGGEVWGSLNYSSNATGSGAQLPGLDVVVTNLGTGPSPFTQSALSSLLPATFPGMPAIGQAINIVVENPAQPGAPANMVGNSAVLHFASDITRPASGTKTIYVSYLISFAADGQLGAGNDGRFLAYLESSNLFEPAFLAYSTNWKAMFNTFNSTVTYAGHGLLQKANSGNNVSGSAYFGAYDNSTGKDFSTSPFVVAMSPTNAGAPPSAPSFVVGAYVFNASGKDTNLVWVNPSVGAFGGPTPPSGPEVDTMAYNLTDIGGLCLIDRVGSGASGGVPTNYFANLIIGSTWSYVTGGPEFTTQPATAYGNVGGNASLTAVATAAAQTVNYQWLHVVGGVTNAVVNGAGGAGGSAIVSGATTGTLSLAGIGAPETNGFYLVTATASGTGYALNSSSTTVIFDPLITGQPQEAFTTPGGTANFSITATTQFPSLAYQWQIGGVNLTDGTQADSSVISGSSTAALTIANAQRSQNNSLITCGVTNGLGQGEISASALLITTDPAITSGPLPTQASVNYGGTVSYTANILTSVAHQPITYAWFFVDTNGNTNMLANGTKADGSTVNGATGTSTTNAISAVLTLGSLGYLDNGSYFLIATNSVGGFNTSSSSTLFVTDPYIAVQPPTNAEVALNGNLTIPVVASGTAVIYQWNDLTGTFSGDFSGVTTSALQISGAQPTDAGQYDLTVTGPTNTLTSVTVNLFVDTAVTSVALSPASLTQQAGTHLALVGNVVGGTGGELYYIWKQNSNFLTHGGLQADGTTIYGFGTPTLVLSNLHAADSGTYTLIASNAAGSMSAPSAVTVSSSLLPLAPTNLVVTRVGEGAEPLSGATGNTVYLDQFQTNGLYVSSIMVPDFGGSTLIDPGAAPTSGTDDSMNETYLTLSSNKQYLNLSGYFQNYPYTGGPTVTFGGAANPRSIGAVNGAGFYILAYTNEGLYSGGQAFIRDAFSTDGLTNFWTAGAAGSAAIKYVNAGPAGAGYATGSGIPGMSDAVTGPVCLGLAGTNLVFSDMTTDANLLPGVGPGNAAQGLDIFSGAPQSQPPSDGATNLVYSSESVADFAFSPDLNTLYIADSSQLVAGGTNYGGGIERYDLVGGIYTYAYTLQDTTIAGGTNGLRGLAVNFPSSITTWGTGVLGAQLYGTTSETETNRLVEFTDNGASSTDALLATAGTNEFFRGVRFAPVTLPVTVVTAPVAPNAYSGQTETLTVGVSGTLPLHYQWQFDGTNIANATNSSLVLANLSATNGGTYTVIISNTISTTNSSVVLSISNSAPVLLASSLQSRVETVGDHLGFAVSLTGSLPIKYQWSLNGTNIASATSSSIILTNIQLTNSGSYTVTYSNVYGSNTGSATLLVTAAHQFLSSNNLVVARVGDGVQALSDTTGNTLYLDQFTTSGAYSNTIMIPDNSPANDLIVGGGPNLGLLESVLNLAVNSNFLNFAGYFTNYPNTSSPAFTTGSTSTPAGSVFRSIGAVNPFGYYTLAQVNDTTYSTSPFGFFSVASLDGLDEFWSTGDGGAGGLKYLIPSTAGSTGGNYSPGGSSFGTRVIEVINGDVVYSESTGSPGAPPGIYGFPGEPTASSPMTATSLIVDAAGSPEDFAASPDTTSFPPTTSTVYLADTLPVASGGGIQRYDWNGSAYALSYTLPVTVGTNGAGCLTVDFSANATWGAGVNGAIVYATTAGGSGNQLVKIIDNGPGSAPTVLAAAAGNEILRGVRFGPVIAPLDLVTNPADVAAEVGQEADFSVVVTGSGPVTYQWAVNGTNIANATNSAYSIPNVQGSNAGSYTVVASNPAGQSVTNSPAAILTVGAFNPSANLVGWWQFNDGSGSTAADSSTNANAGTLQSFPSDNSEWVAGLGGLGALGFADADSNSDNVVIVNDESQLDFNVNLAFTLAAWVLPASSNQVSGAAAIAKGTGNGGEEYTLDVYQGVYRLYVRSTASGNPATDLISAVRPTSNLWQHVVATYDGFSRIMALYVNGQLVTNNSIGPNSLQANLYQLTIGNRTSSASSAFDLPFLGNMQDIRIYNVALGLQDVQAIYSILAPTPQIAVFNGAVVVTNGQTSPAVSFGTTPQFGTAPIVTLTITNSGSAALNIGTISVPAGYTLSGSPPASIAPGSSGTFSVQLGAGAAGTFSGTVSIPNNSTANPYTFAVTGTITTAVQPQFAHVAVTGQPAAPVLHYSGTAGTTYKIWSTTNLALKPVNSTWTLLGTGTFSGGADTFAVPTNQPSPAFFILTQP